MSGVTEGVRLEERIRDRARRMGFDLVGITAPGDGAHGAWFEEWLGRGYHGEMSYLARDSTRERRLDLSKTLPDVASVIVVGHAYDPGTHAEESAAGDRARAIFARYARGRDYHDVIAPRLAALHGWIETQVGRPVGGRAYTDTGPLLERELGMRAGLGWFGRNTMLIHPRRGSYFFLGVLLLDLDLRPDPEFTSDHCGTCQACVTACPTGALLGRTPDGAPVMDARKCISYLTIELKGPIPHALRPLMGNRVFGCDICQEVCPFNLKFAQPSAEPEYTPRTEFSGPLLIQLTERVLALSGRGFKRTFAGSPVLRAGRKGLLRNLCVALGNWGSEEAVPTLVSALSDRSALVRGHAVWALGRVGSAAARRVLAERLSREEDATVRAEIEAVPGLVTD